MPKHSVAIRWTGPDGRKCAEIKSSWHSRERAEASAKKYAAGFSPGTALEIEYLGDNDVTRY
ncbi:hypothetical protein C9F11_10275 [Streptomyces sp. YIM 121038]|nr:hypothetical protein C9F11_10275 [Streptomyces sp. YIM 121038]